MEHASLGIAVLAARLAGPRGTVVVLAGPGNNGGDGYGAARRLAGWGLSVQVLQVARRDADPEGDAGREAAWAAQEARVEGAWRLPGPPDHEALAGATVLVDALFGVGLDRDLEAPFPSWIEAVNDAPALRLAVDVPSGLDADTGVLRPVAVRADVTATMALPKEGLVRGEGPAHAGHVVEIDIGLPWALHGPYVRDA
jgi:hydroxyethylthiazole kinase-like uncharacterized protein yjeF